MVDMHCNWKVFALLVNCQFNLMRCIFWQRLKTWAWWRHFPKKTHFSWSWWLCATDSTCPIGGNHWFRLFAWRLWGSHMAIRNDIFASKAIVENAIQVGNSFFNGLSNLNIARYFLVRQESICIDWESLSEKLKCQSSNFC